MIAASESFRKELLRPDVELVDLLELYTDHSEDPPYSTIKYRFCQADRDLVVASQTYRSLSFRRGGIQRTLGDQKASVNLRLDNVTLEGTALILRAKIDGSRAVIRVASREFLTNLSDTIVIFDGVVGNPSVDHSALTIEVTTRMERMGSMLIPRRVYHPQCNYLFGDGACTKDREATALTDSTGTQTGSTRWRIFYSSSWKTASESAAGAGNFNSYWEEGYARFTSGKNKGFWSPFAFFDENAQFVHLQAPLPFDPEVGDTYVTKQGCNNTKQMCHAVHANLSNYGGFAEIPFQPSRLR